jgi:hypothetical protein
MPQSPRFRVMNLWAILHDSVFQASEGNHSYGEIYFILLCVFHYLCIHLRVCAVLCVVRTSHTYTKNRQSITISGGRRIRATITTILCVPKMKEHVRVREGTN